MQKLTQIGWIGELKKQGDEWSVFQKKIQITEKPRRVVIRLDSYGVAGIYVNGEFVEGSTGRYAGRIVCIECTSKFVIGENEISLKLGNHYFQAAGVTNYERRKRWFSAIAAEIKIEYDASEETIVTDESWTCISDCGVTVPQRLSDVTEAYYDRFWKSAALWEEPKEYQIPTEIADLMGEEYCDYAHTPLKQYIEPKVTYGVKQDLEKKTSFIDLDFGRVCVGYLEIEYESELDGRVKMRFDYSESVTEIEQDSRLTLRYGIKKGHHVLFVNHRRAARYVRVQFDQGAQNAKCIRVRFRQSMKPDAQLGWFKCQDEELNRIWEVGKYTLWVNKHQEYESCPKSEMKFFTGDGIVAALIDYYTFGDGSLVDSSLAITEIQSNSGIQHNIYDRNTSLWDYPAWRIIMLYNHYIYQGDLEVVKKYYDDVALNTQWMIEKMNRDGLIYQYPLFGGPFYEGSGTVEFSCSFDRLGEKPYLNALLYKSLLCMSVLAEAVGDARGEEWKQLASTVKKAINDKLWSEEDGAYIDAYDKTYIPQDGNALAVLWGIADEEKANQALVTLKNENWSEYGSALANKVVEHTRGGVQTISPMMCSHEAEARFKLGRPEEALDLIHRCWGTMLKKGAQTFWEFSPNNGVKNWRVTSHGWSAGCTYLLSAYVLGVRPTSPGYETMVFEPYEGFEDFAGVVPTVKGLVGVKCETINGTKSFTLCIPKGIKVEIKTSLDAKVQVIEQAE